MGISSDLLNAPREFLRLFKAGKEAARAGDHTQAHRLFRQAVEVDPYHEQVWLWLASVVETDEDRRVCFENVLELNPTNPVARQQLQKLEQSALDEALAAEIAARRGLSLGRKFFRLALILILVVEIGVVVMWSLN